MYFLVINFIMKLNDLLKNILKELLLDHFSDLVNENDLKMCSEPFNVKLTGVSFV